MMGRGPSLRTSLLVVPSPQSIVAVDSGAAGVDWPPSSRNEYAFSAVASRVTFPVPAAAADLLVNVLNPADFAAVSGEPLGSAPLAAGCGASPANARVGTSATVAARTAIIVAIR